MNEKKRLNIQRVGENAFEDLNNILKGVWIDYRENIGKGPNGEIVHSLCHPVLKKTFVINVKFFILRYSKIIIQSN